MTIPWWLVRVSVLLVVTAVSLAGGMALGYYVVPDTKSERAECIILSKDVRTLTYDPGTSIYTPAEFESSREVGRSIVDRYNELCR